MVGHLESLEKGLLYAQVMRSGGPRIIDGEGLTNRGSRSGRGTTDKEKPHTDIPLSYLP